jgi:hypothetical protein
VTILGSRLVIVILLVLPVVWLPIQYDVPLSPTTVLAAVVWIGTLALVVLTAWPRSGR